MGNKHRKEKIKFAVKHPKLYGGIRLFLSLIVLLALIALVGLIAYLVFKLVLSGFNKFISWIKDTVSGLDSVVVVALVSGTVSLIGVLFTSVISKIIEYRQKRREYLDVKREKSYGQFVDMYLNFLNN